VWICILLLSKGLFIALSTLVSGEKPGFQALSKGLIILPFAEVIWQGVPDHGAVNSESSASNSTGYMLLCGLDMKSEHWAEMCRKNKWNNVDLRDGRYNQVIHMVSAAKGAEDFYDNVNHVTRHEGIEQARMLDDLTAQV